MALRTCFLFIAGLISLFCRKTSWKHRCSDKECEFGSDLWREQADLRSAAETFLRKGGCAAGRRLSNAPTTLRRCAAGRPKLSLRRSELQSNPIKARTIAPISPFRSLPRPARYTPLWTRRWSASNGKMAELEPEPAHNTLVLRTKSLRSVEGSSLDVNMASASRCRLSNRSANCETGRLQQLGLIFRIYARRQESDLVKLRRICGAGDDKMSPGV